MSSFYIREDQVIESAMTIIERKLVNAGQVFSSSTEIKNHASLTFSSREREVFAIYFFNTEHRLICYRELFFGSIASCAVYPREIMKACLELNASAIILAHNHPSGNVEPSRADKEITQIIKTLLQHIDVSVLDHIIVSGARCCSFAERGLL